jgi:glutamine synthetase
VNTRNDRGAVASAPDSETLLANLRSEGVRAVRVLYSDLHGVARGKDVPLEQFPGLAADGLAFCAAVLTTDLRHTPVVGGEAGYQDLVAKPDLATLRVVPWQPELAWCLADLETIDRSRRHPACPRGALRAAVRAFQEQGYEPVVGPELEFFLLERDPSARGGLRRYVDELSRVYTVGSVSDPKGIVLEMLHACDALGLGAFAANHEFMNSQYEINVRHSEALDAADRAFMLRAAVKELAAREGMVATFMGKPFNDQGGSGFHAHLSLCDTGGANVCADPGGHEGLSAAARHAVAGILEHAAALMALLAPTINAYRRIVPDSLAPTHANWGHDNRTAFVRVPRERGSHTRLEVRAGDASANAHLAIAGLLLAALDGIQRELEPPDPVEGDAYRLDEASSGSALPGDLGQALDALEADAVLRDALGRPLVEAFLAVKRFELERFAQWTSDWELEEYAAHL